MKIIRVFPRRTKATPIDPLVRIDEPPGLFDEADEVHISVTFTWDLPRADELFNQWKHIAPTKIGGPATGDPGGPFTPGTYLKHGYTITSRGCPNKCWFCDVWKREGNIRELPIQPGSNVLDDNLLACSPDHIANVLAMLKKQPKPQLTGGLEPKRLTQEIANNLITIKPKQLFFAYDTQDDKQYLKPAMQYLLNSGFTIASHALRCYVLIGYPKDTFSKATERLSYTLKTGFTPMAMLYRNRQGLTDPKWRSFQRMWARPAIIHA